MVLTIFAINAVETLMSGANCSDKVRHNDLCQVLGVNVINGMLQGFKPGK